MAEQYWLPQAAPVCVYVLFADDPIATQGGTSNDRASYGKMKGKHSQTLADFSEQPLKGPFRLNFWFPTIQELCFVGSCRN